MKFLAPLGKESNSTVKPQACQCSTWTAFARRRGSNDTCWHCGCQCNGNNYSSRNAMNATTTFRKS